jgi:phage portal protein BeeE
MEEYGVLLINRDDNKRAGLIRINPSGVLVAKGGEEEWHYGVYKSLMSTLRAIALPEPLYKKYHLKSKNSEKLPECVMIIEAWEIAEAINKNEVHILKHQVKAQPIII